MNTLKKIYDDDIQDRNSQIWGTASRNEVKQLRERDKKRREKVLLQYRNGQIRIAADYHHAAFILQHGETSGDYKMANEFAKEAIKLGDESAKWLYAATLDRYLCSIGKPQKFGTQFRLNKMKEWELALPVDPSVTDGERAENNVPPLSQALQKFKEKYNL